MKSHVTHVPLILALLHPPSPAVLIFPSHKTSPSLWCHWTCMPLPTGPPWTTLLIYIKVALFLYYPTRSCDCCLDCCLEKPGSYMKSSNNHSPSHKPIPLFCWYGINGFTSEAEKNITPALLLKNGTIVRIKSSFYSILPLSSLLAELFSNPRKNQQRDLLPYLPLTMTQAASNKARPSPLNLPTFDLFLSWAFRNPIRAHTSVTSSKVVQNDAIHITHTHSEPGIWKAHMGSDSMETLPLHGCSMRRVIFAGSIPKGERKPFLYFWECPNWILKLLRVPKWKTTWRGSLQELVTM